MKIRIFIKRREDILPYSNYIVPIGSIILSLIISDAILIIYGIDPLALFKVIMKSALNYNSVRYSIPLILTGIGLAITYKANVWNIGGEGQILAGALASSGLALFYLPKGYNEITYIVVILIVSFLSGALIAIIPAILKAYFNVNEVLSTLMLNYILIQLVNYLVYGPWRGSKEYGYPRTNIFPNYLWFPSLKINNIQTNISIPTLVIAILASGIFYMFLYKSKWGYEIRIIGSNPKAAKYAGINIKKTILITMIVSGGLAGVAGAGEVLGVYRQLIRAERVSAGFGYTAIIVAWLGNLNPIGALIAGYFMGMLISSSYTMQILTNLSYGAINSIMGILLLCLVSLDFLTKYKLVIRW